jgi:hypothetical protein
MARSKFVPLVAPGENPLGMRAQTPNGTASDCGDGWNTDYHYGPPANGERWTMPQPEFDQFSVMPGNGGSKKPAGRGANKRLNRTGE